MEKTIMSVLKQLAEKNQKSLSTLQIQIESDLLPQPFIHSSSKPDASFHSASVGKMMTAVVIVQAIEKGWLDWNATVESILGPLLLEGLFDYRGISYSSSVTVEQLLGHQSGVNDYFEGKSTLKPSLIDRVIQEKDVFYKPTDLLDITRNHQSPLAPPNKTFHYSDTGYVLLGLIAEKVYKVPFHVVLRENIFDRLGMDHTGLLFYDPKVSIETIEPVIVRNVDVRLHQSLSIDFSGGGLSTTTQDLTRFLKAIRDFTLISEDSYKKMAHCSNHFEAGMYYGLGLMELRFEKFFFLLKGLPRLYGHLGVLGVHAWFNPSTGDTFVINVGNMNQMVSSFQLLIQLVMTIEKKRKIRKA